MKGARPPRSTGLTNELAKERNRAAAERTIIAWMQHCLTLIGLGIAFDQIGQALVQRSLINNLSVQSRMLSYLALGFILFATLLLGIALRQYRLAVKSIEHKDYVLLSIRELNQLIVIAVVLFGLLSGVAVLVTF